MKASELWFVQCADGELFQEPTCDDGCSSFRVFSTLTDAKLSAAMLDADFRGYLPEAAEEWLKRGRLCCSGPHKVVHFREVQK